MRESEASWRIRRYKEQQKQKPRSTFLQRGKKIIGQMGSIGKTVIKKSGGVVREVAKESRPYLKQGSGYSARVSSQMRSSPLFGGGGWGSFDRPRPKPRKKGGRTITVRVVTSGATVKKRSHKKRKQTRQPFSLF